MQNPLQSLRLEVKFFLGMMLLICGILLGMLYLVFTREKQLILQEVETRAHDLTEMLAFTSKPEMARNNYGALQTFIDGLKYRPDLHQVMVFNTAGKVLAHSDVAECDKIYTDLLTQRILSSQTFIALPAYHLNGEKILDVAIPIFLNARQKIGFSRVIISLERTDEAIRDLTWRVLGLGVAGVFVAFILAAIFSRLVTQPLRRLDEKALQISRGERDIQIEVTAQDEIGHLQQALKTMVEDVRLQSRLSALGATTASLAHEIRTPLIVIARHIKEWMKQSATPEMGDKLLGQVGQLNDLVNQLLEFSRKSKITRTRTDVNELLRETLSLLADQLKERRINLQHNFQELPMIAVDKNLLPGVFRNLIINAVQAMPENGELHLQTQILSRLSDDPRQTTSISSTATAPAKATGRLQKKWRRFKKIFLVETVERARRMLLAKLPPEKQAVMITIQDNGCGIPPDVMERLFLPFVTTKKDGTGLGLAWSHKIIQEHQGTITVVSTEGYGTTFTILLPV